MGEWRAQGARRHWTDAPPAIAAHEDAAAVLIVERELGDCLDRLAVGALVVVEVAVIDVGGVPAATVGDADEAAVQARHAPALAVADGGVPAAGPVSGATLEADGLRARPAAGGEQGGDGHDGQPRTAPRVNFPHVSPCFPEGLKDARAGQACGLNALRSA